MELDREKIKNKQRILIGGNRGVSEIFNIAKTVLNHIGKPVDFYEAGDELKLTDAPVLIIRGGDTLENGTAQFQKLDVHILLVHGISDQLPDGYKSFEEYVAQYEMLADTLPKAGTYIYYEGDDVATLMGKKEREDVRNIEYSSLKSDMAPGLNDDLLACAAGARTLLNRIGINDEQFFAGIKTLK